LAKTIKRELKKYLVKNVYIAGIQITLSGLVAGAHLGGIGGIRKFLASGSGPKDVSGTSVKSYIKRFVGYDLGLT